jgi:hypothetical protein
MSSPISLVGFAGAATDPSARLLDGRVGVKVTNAEPHGGDLRPMRASVQVTIVPAGRGTIFRLGQGVASDTDYWLSWPGTVNVVRSNDGADTTERIFYTGDGGPKWTNNIIGLAGGAPYPQGSRDDWVPAPVSAPIATLTTDGAGTDGTRFYVSTFVNDLGWESAPSPTSGPLTAKVGAVVTISGLEPAPAGNFNITKRRIYATSPGTAGTAGLLFLREVPIATTSTTDDARQLGETLATIGHIPPPANAYGLIGLWNGMYAMLSGKSVLFTEPLQPYTTPAAYDIDLTDQPVALARWEQNLLVLTMGAPVLLQGQDPAGMSETPFRVGFACSSARSAVSFDHGVVWASAEGAAYSGSEVLLTKGIVTADQWKAMNPSTMIAGRWRSLYVCSYDDGTGRKAFMLDPLNLSMGIWHLDEGFDACYYDKLQDQLYILVGAAIKKFNAGANLTATFKSKVFRQGSPRNFGYAKVVADSYPRVLKVWVDGFLRNSRIIGDERMVSLAGGFKGLDWQIEIDSVDSVQGAYLAAKPKDLGVG